MTNKKYFTIDNLKSLGDSKFDQLKGLAIDSGQAFLSGQVTNFAFKSTQEKTVKSLTNLSSAGLGSYAIGSQMIDNREEIITTLSNEIVSQVTTIITKEVSASTSKYLLNHTKQIASFPKDVLSYATSYFNAYKGELSKEVLNEFLKTAEDRAKETKEKSKKERQSNFMGKIKEDSTKAIEKINEYTSTATSYINIITSYLEAGPDWVSQQIDKQISGLVKNVNKNIDDQWNNKDLPAYKEKIESLGTSIGQGMLEEYHNLLKKAQKKLVEQTEKIKCQSNLKILQAKATAASKIASMTGFYIPF